MIITNLEKRIGDLTISIPALRLAPGKIHGLLGGNGCGKSTLAKLLMGAMDLDAGQIDWEGLGPREITLMAQRPYLLKRTVLENLTYPLTIRHLKPEGGELEGWLRQAGLWEKRDQYAPGLSSGERQKLSFIRALVFKPRFVIIDETLSNLDPESLVQFENFIHAWQEKEPITWLIISHQLAQINNLCNQVHFMEKGRIIESGETDQVIFNPQTQAVSRYMQCQRV
ncbi:ATP-binding cassette domain-containing protein [Eubacterium barkeri]|uniref:Carbohydrate ABC transporter ATP-binding protein, CUT1 family n=1 Tax=Eubacterium barkeri TaxID=1528 RepID=A0A1H3FUU6_EUBBA|nr:ABC transporter ATP-binding protein [Eubacterium barkeri]SDX93899.1 carbohydrate ABC transporter ATP-binding protein, CUT1 family [Eubacterium barkeri]